MSVFHSAILSAPPWVPRMVNEAFHCQVYQIVESDGLLVSLKMQMYRRQSVTIALGNIDE